MSSLPSDYDERKALPIATGVIDYFPKALAAVAHCSVDGNAQHNPGEPLHWAREKSTDEANTLIRHFVDRGKFDANGVRHSAKVAWRALAMLEKEIEADGGRIHGPADPPPPLSLCGTCEIRRAVALNSRHVGYVLCDRCAHHFNGGDTTRKFPVLTGEKMCEDCARARRAAGWRGADRSPPLCQSCEAKASGLSSDPPSSADHT